MLMALSFLGRNEVLQLLSSDFCVNFRKIQGKIEFFVQFSAKGDF